MSLLDLHTIARATGGRVVGRQVLAPGPGHSPGDASLSIRLSHQSPTGFIVFSHSGDDFRISRDYVAERLGFGSDAWRRREKSRQFGDTRQRSSNDRFTADHADHAARIARARTLWDESYDAHRTLAELYLKNRGLDLPEGTDVLRFNPKTPWQENDGSLVYTACMITVLRSIATDKIQCVQRTRLSENGAKIGRKMTGPSSGAAIKIDPDDAVTMGLAISEGLESGLAARQLRFRPCWALGSAGAIAAFPPLAGIESLSILAERDKANRKATEVCATRWHVTGHEVIVVEPASGSDILDALRGAA